jgi:hypothetical protein
MVTMMAKIGQMFDEKAELVLGGLVQFALIVAGCVVAVRDWLVFDKEVDLAQDSIKMIVMMALGTVVLAASCGIFKLMG